MQPNQAWTTPASNEPIGSSNKWNITGRVANSTAPAHNAAMSNDITREELDTKIELIEARSDARMNRFEERIDQAIGEMRRDRAELKADFQEFRKEVRDSSRSLKATMIVTGISVAVAVIGANIGLVQTMFGAFESGKSTATAITQATEELRAIRERLDRKESQALTAPMPSVPPIQAK